MKQYDLKRAMVNVIERGSFRSEKDLQRHITAYKDAIKKLGPIADREQNKEYKKFAYEIKKLRSKAREFRANRWLFKVWVKAYQQDQVVEWSFQHQEFGPAYRKEFQDMLKGVVNQAIKQCRVGSQICARPDKFAGVVTEFMGKKKQGRVFSKEGEVLRIYVEKNLQSLYDDKRPVEPRKYIGIELEFCAPIKENQFAVKLFKSGIHKFAQLKKDGSLRPYPNETGYELAILLEESNYKKRLKQITTLLSQVGAVAEGRRAGLHVHIDMRRRNKDLVYNNLVSCQYALLSIVDPKRYNNEFCRVVESRKFPTEFTGQREERYKTINAAAFYKYKTLEIRMHEGSVDFTQISNWVDLLIRISNYSKKLKNNVAKVSTLGKRFNLEKKLFNYMQDRSCFWQVQNTREAGNLRHGLNHLEELNEIRRRMRDLPENQLGTTLQPPQAQQPQENGYVAATRRLWDAYNAVTPVAGGGGAGIVTGAAMMLDDDPYRLDIMPIVPAQNNVTMRTGHVNVGQVVENAAHAMYAEAPAPFEPDLDFGDLLDEEE